MGGIRMSCFHLAAVVIGLSLAAFIGGFATIGVDWFEAWAPDYEGRTWPIIATGKPYNITRDEERTCYTIPMRKLRTAAPLTMVFELQAALGGTFPLLAYPTDSSYVPTRELVMNHPAGERWERSFCFQNPQTVSDMQGFTVSGSARYQVPHRLWVVAQPLPSFDVPPLKPAPR